MANLAIQIYSKLLDLGGRDDGHCTECGEGWRQPRTKGAHAPGCVLGALLVQLKDEKRVLEMNAATDAFDALSEIVYGNRERGIKLARKLLVDVREVKP